MIRLETHDFRLASRAIILTTLSAAFGISLCAWMHNDPGSWIPSVLLGLAHGVAFIPLTMKIGHNPLRKCVGVIACLTWVFWGFWLMMLLTSIAASLASSVVWGIVIAWTWRRVWALPIMLAVGLISLASTFVMMGRWPAWKSDWLIPETIAVWYLLMIPALPLIVVTRPWGTTKPSSGMVCMACQYPLRDVPKVTRCTECGGPKSVCPECGLTQYQDDR